MNKVEDFIKRTERGSHLVVNTWKNYAMNHFHYFTSVQKPKAEEFYKAVKASSEAGHIIVNMTPAELSEFLTSGFYSQEQGTKRTQAKQAMGLSDAYTIFGTYSKNKEGIRKFGECSIVLKVDDVVLFPGDPSRFRDPSRADYAPDPSEVLFPMVNAADCKAVATILAMDASDLSGIELALVNALDTGKEYGRCSALIFDRIKQSDVSGIYVPTKELADRFRDIMDGLGHAMRIEISNNGIRTKDPFSFREGDDVKIQKSKEMKYFSVGDKVCTKTTITTAPLVSGTIIDMNNGKIVVDWDHEQRTMYDMAEALMYLMPAPVKHADKYGDVIYSIPGMDSKTAGLLDAIGVDPVTIYSLVSHVRPATDKDESWRNRLVEAMEDMGIDGEFVSGYLETTSGFEPRDWYQASLVCGTRLVISFGDGKFAIQAGELEDYISR